jgi:hypothetical protein
MMKALLLLATLLQAVSSPLHYRPLTIFLIVPTIVLTLLPIAVRHLPLIIATVHLHQRLTIAHHIRQPIHTSIPPQHPPILLILHTLLHTAPLSLRSPATWESNTSYLTHLLRLILLTRQLLLLSLSPLKHPTLAILP